MVDTLGILGIDRAVNLRPAGALGTLVSRGFVDVVDGEARLSDRGRIVADQRRRGTGWL